VNLHVHADADAAVRAVAGAIRDASHAPVERFAIALAGGSTPQAAYRVLAASPYAEEVAWHRWHVFFGDERKVPLDDERSNYRQACESLLDHVPIPSNHVHALVDPEIYEGLLRSFFGEAPDFDVLLLGMGADGHTASLFPGSIALLERERWVIEPPDVVEGMARLTLTLPALLSARRTLFLVTGEAKAGALARIAAGEPLPAGMIPGAEWHVDTAAASELPPGRLA
jgi:6-phosphogluconolactonase